MTTQNTLIKIPENQIHRAFFRWIFEKEKTDERYEYFFHPPNGEEREKRIAGMLLTMGVRRGVMDFLCPFPNKGFNGLAIELKSIDGVVSKHQMKWMRMLSAANWDVHICRSYESAVEVAENYMK